MESGWYDTAQICLNGHVITNSSKKYPQFMKNFCDRYGEPTITTCPECNQEIKGYYHTPHVISPSNIPAPNYCTNCGKAFPWTVSKMKAAKDLIEESDNLTKEEKEDFDKNLEVIVKESPQTPVARARLRKYLLKRVLQPLMV